MTLSETEHILQDLSKRHPNLNKELLTTILTASGWEERAIQDAVLLLGQRQGPEGSTASPVAGIPSGVAEVSVAIDEEENVLEKSGDDVIGLVDHQLHQAVKQEEVHSIPPSLDPPSNLKKIQTFQQDGGLVTATTATPIPVPDTREKKEAVEKMIATLSDIRQPVSGSAEVIVEPVVLVPLANEAVVNDMTFYKNDGEEEGELHVFEDVPHVEEKKVPTFIAPVVEVPSQVEQAEVKEVVHEAIVETIKTKKVEELIHTLEKTVPTPSSVSEPESLIVHDEPKAVTPKTPSQVEIPENLPLLPFESSPHIWSFSRYKDVFHSEPKPEPVKVVPVVVTPVFVQEPYTKPVLPVQQFSTPKKVYITAIETEESSDDDEISLEKVPLTKGDESLVFLAGAMLLVIILILGYMYSNGRL